MAAQQSVDVAVIGGGIAGVAIASELAPRARVLLLERESALAYHSSGRSAALYIEPYSNLPVFGLTRGSRDFLLQPPPAFSPVPLATPRGSLTLAPAGQEALLDAFLAEWQALCPGIVEIEPAAALEAVPVLRPGYVSRAAYDPDVFALDTAAMLQGWRRQLLAHGGREQTGAEVLGLRRRAARWAITTTVGEFHAEVVVNAAGAWAGEIAALAGARALPLTPKRRSAALMAAPEGHRVDRWPVVADASHRFYFKPEAGALMLSPADATPTAACDARPEEMDLALGVARAEEAAALGVRRFLATWAGLRTFLPDAVPAYGWDDEIPGFYWAVGQGGSGFQTAPAAARWAVAEIAGHPAPEDLLQQGLSRAALSPARRF